MRKSKRRTQDVVPSSGRSSIRVLRDEEEIREAYQRVINAERRNAGLINDRVAHFENLHSTVGGQHVDGATPGPQLRATEELPSAIRSAYQYLAGSDSDAPEAALELPAADRSPVPYRTS